MTPSQTNPLCTCEPADLTWMHELNQLYATELSSMSAAQFAAHVAKASYARVIQDQAAFLLAFDQSATNDSPNFNWHKRYAASLAAPMSASPSAAAVPDEAAGQIISAPASHFIYVDRIVVAPAHQRKGLANRLYANLFALADQQGHCPVVCEVNAQPANPASDAFHAALGFEIVGEARLPAQNKTVRYLVRGAYRADIAKSFETGPFGNSGHKPRR